MEMKEWAKREVELACERERKNSEEGEFNYGVACYESALRAFESLLGDDHSGMSIRFTKMIINRLIDGKPLTPIEDTDDIWDEKTWKADDGSTVYQCNRMYSLFKHVRPDGTVYYDDNDRIVCIDINNPSVRYFNGFVRKIAEEYIQSIEMPYTPLAEPWIVETEDHKINDNVKGDFDTIVIHDILCPDGHEVAVHRYFTEDIETGKFKEITKEKFIEMWNNKYKHAFVA